jgi:hypothetical protein
MEECQDMNKKLAAETLRQLFQQAVTPGMDPIVELVGYLLEDGAGGVAAPKEFPITTEQWLTWNRLVLEQPEKLTQVVAEVIKREWLDLPKDQTSLRPWAACLLLCTLERFETM